MPNLTSTYASFWTLGFCNLREKIKDNDEWTMFQLRLNLKLIAGKGRIRVQKNSATSDECGARLKR
jgi:hypothetical protein